MHYMHSPSFELPSQSVDPTPAKLLTVSNLIGFSPHHLGSGHVDEQAVTREERNRFVSIGQSSKERLIYL